MVSAVDAGQPVNYCTYTRHEKNQRNMPSARFDTRGLRLKAHERLGARRERMRDKVKRKVQRDVTSMQGRHRGNWFEHLRGRGVCQRRLRHELKIGIKNGVPTHRLTV